MAHKFHVLLVEHDSKDHDKTLRMLHYYSYEVTPVKLASNALSILSKEKVKFDLVMANLDSPDSCGFQLLQEVVKRDLLLILMSNDDDPVMITRAIEQGAFLCIKKPVTMQIIGFLWQHVVREKVCRVKENEQIEEVVEYNNMHKKVLPKNDNGIFRKKVWAEWSDELHQKFMVAAIQLGEGRCYPKDILELMNVPGLTRMQVASHLQKCRNAKWLPPGIRKTIPANTETTTPRNKVRRSRTERFGSMPHLDNYSQLCLRQKYQQETNHHHHHEFTMDPPTETNVLENSDEVYHPDQLMLDHHSYPSSDHIETFNMGHLGQTFGVEEPLFTYGFRHPTPSYVTDDVQIFSTLQQEFGTVGSLQSLILDSAANLNQMPMMTNAASEWGEEELESMNEEEIED